MMKLARLFVAILALLFAAPNVHAVDLTKIERSVAKEPAYQGKPKYCLVVFGPEAETRVWLVLDGKTLYVDRNHDGDLTGASNRVKNTGNANFLSFEPGRITAADGKTNYDDLWLLVWNDGRPRVSLGSKVGNDTDWQRTPDDGFRFGDQAKDAPIVHLDGPLSLKLSCQPLTRGKSCSFDVAVGTPGLGKGTFAAYRCGKNSPAAAAEIVFPTKNATDKPIVLKVPVNPPT
jgi:hypothetical protein